jgi:hypothetical protein
MWKLKNKTEKKLLFVNENTQEECVASLVYTDDDFGTFYMFDSMLTMPFQRKYIFDLIQQNERIGIEKKELLDHINSIKEFCQSGDTMKAFGTAMYIESKLKNSIDFERSALLVTALLVVQEDENIGGFSQERAMEKIEQWSQKPAMISFFLNFAQMRITSFLNFVSKSSRLSSEIVSQSMEK